MVALHASRILERVDGGGDGGHRGAGHEGKSTGHPDCPQSQPSHFLNGPRIDASRVSREEE